jgi:hypothetical protein
VGVREGHYYTQLSCYHQLEKRSAQYFCDGIVVPFECNAVKGLCLSCLQRVLQCFLQIHLTLHDFLGKEEKKRKWKQLTMACHTGSTCYDMAIDKRIPTLVRRFESAAKLGAFVSVKVPGMFGLGSEFREYWAVLFQRLPNPRAPPDRRVAHSQLYLFKTYTDAAPAVRLWTDGAEVAMLQNPLRNGASAVLVRTSHPLARHFFFISFFSNISLRTCNYSIFHSVFGKRRHSQGKRLSHAHHAGSLTHANHA